MKFAVKCLIIYCVVIAGYKQASATHYRAGEITYVVTGNLQIQATLVTYSKISGTSIFADRDIVAISWGDGTQDSVGRVNGGVDPMTGYPHYGQLVAPDIKQNIYVGNHTYSGVPPYPNNFAVVSFLDNNRLAGINNISNGSSVDVPFYVEDTIWFLDINNIGLSSSPILLHPPIDYADVNDTFYHNPLAIDTAGDSLSFALKVPLDAQGTDVPLYQYPDQYCIQQGEKGATCTIDVHTGEVTWAVPCVTGLFNIAILVHAYRHGINLGSVERDMQIIVLQNNDQPPRIAAIPDTCIRAGDTLTRIIHATDPDNGQTVTLTADGGPFHVNTSPATFNSTPANPASGTFTWYTTCDHIQVQPYLALFDASDNYIDGSNAAPLVALTPWQIYVIPPPVENLTAVAQHSSVTLNWLNPYRCASNPDFRGFSVWRKIGCDPFTPGYCETGLAGTGYIKITTTNIQAYTYTDNTAIVGQEYSYRVLAEFYKLPPSGVVALQYDNQESVPSNEACVFVPISLPVILNVSVNNTDVTNGSIFVRWTKPPAGSINLDTIQNPPPYRFDVYRDKGDNFTSAATLIHSSVIANSYSTLTDTTYTDSLIDTKTTPWTYQIQFFSNNDSLGWTQPASSVYLTASPSNKSLNLNWHEQVPWLNDSFAVFKLNKITTAYDSIATAYTHSYTDTGLINDTTYCYFVKAYGHYTVGTLPSPLINFSEQDCASPNDTTPPCPPVLSVRNDCGQYQNQPWDTANSFINYLTWTNPNDSCAFDITRYYIYYGNDSAGLSIIDSTLSKGDTLYNHVQKDNLAGCYAITAVSAVGNQSHFSNVVCIDNCPYYVLPNAFTPNGDGHNDLFTPFHPYRFVTKIEMKIYNRWGEQVFETNDPEINWNGKDQKSGKDVSDGVYLYAGYYYEQHQTGLIRKPLSGEKKGGGFIELIRGDSKQ